MYHTLSENKRTIFNFSGFGDNIQSRTQQDTQLIELDRNLQRRDFVELKSPKIKDTFYIPHFNI